MKQLRSIRNIHWPKSLISNKALYKRCNCTPLTKRIEKLRWTMLGHVLRSEETTPAQLALQYALNGARQYEIRLGRPRINLLDTLIKDLKCRNINLKTPEDLYNVRNIASNRKCWRTLF